MIPKDQTSSPDVSSWNFERENSPLLRHEKCNPRDDKGLGRISSTRKQISSKLVQLSPSTQIQRPNTQHIFLSRNTKLSTTKELKEIVELALPIIGTYLFEMLPSLVSIILVGHISSTNQASEATTSQIFLGSATLSITFVNIIAIYPGLGLCSAMDTLCSQAFGMAGEKEEEYCMVIGTLLQTAFFVLGCVSVLVIAVGCFTEDFLIAFGEPPEVAKKAGDFTLWMLPGIPFLYMYELLRKVLQAQNVATPMFYVSMMSNVINIVMGYYLVYHTSWGFLGAALARTLCNISFPLLLICYIYANRSSLKPFWKGMRHCRCSYRSIPQFLELGIPSALQIGVEWWAFEIVTLMSGWLPNAVEALGANAVVQNVTSLASMLYWGISIAGNVRIGQALGSGETSRARLTSNIVMGLAFVSSLVCGVIIMLSRNIIPRLFTHDRFIQELSTKLLMVAAVFQIPDAVNGGVQGIFRGCGRQGLGAKLLFLGYYFVGLPVGWWLGFSTRINTTFVGVVGLWIGMTAGATLVATSGWYIVLRHSKWSQLSKEASERIISFHSASFGEEVEETQPSSQTHII